MAAKRSDVDPLCTAFTPGLSDEKGFPCCVFGSVSHSYVFVDVTTCSAI